MAKGQIAKDYVAKKLAEAFGEHYIGEIDKKYYVEAPENGELLQIAITMTCPKTPVTVAGYKPAIHNGGMDFENMAAVAPPKVTEISDEERENIANMMARLGL